MSDEVERFLGASRILSNMDHLPQRGWQRQERFGAAGVDRVVLGQMLSQVAIVPMAVDAVTVIRYDGDETTLSGLSATVRGRSLMVQGPVPFTPGGSLGGNFFFGDTVSVTSVSGSFTNITVNGVSGTRAASIIFDGREVDLSRSIRVGVIEAFRAR